MHDKLDRKTVLQQKEKPAEELLRRLGSALCWLMLGPQHKKEEYDVMVTADGYVYVWYVTNKSPS